MSQGHRQGLTLAALRPGERGRITGLSAAGMMRRRMMDLGLLEGAEVEVVMSSPLGDPRAYRVRGAMIALREVDARGITVESLAAGEES